MDILFTCSELKDLIVSLGANQHTAAIERLGKCISFYWALTKQFLEISGQTIRDWQTLKAKEQEGHCNNAAQAGWRMQCAWLYTRQKVPQELEVCHAPGADTFIYKLAQRSHEIRCTFLNCTHGPSRCFRGTIHSWFGQTRGPQQCPCEGPLQSWAGASMFVVTHQSQLIITAGSGMLDRCTRNVNVMPQTLFLPSEDVSF